MPFRSPSAPAFVSVSVAACFGLFACDNDYPIAPTACDDWCHATQRADCKEDESPADCVSSCEADALGRRHPECEASWLALSECYRNAPNGAFSCVDGYSRPSNTVCLNERRAANYCVSERMGSCFDKCVREAEACGSALATCEHECSTTSEDCEQEHLELDRCLSKAPVLCDSAGPPGELPCCEPLVSLLRCAGYEGEGCPPQ